jgi:signal transduction histidine kinase
MSVKAAASSQPVVLILAPFGRDGQTLAAVVMRAGRHSQICADGAALCSAFNEQTLAILMTEEALAEAADRLDACLTEQPTWSDVPLIMLSGGRGRAGTEERWTFLQRFGNLTILDRPLAANALSMALKAAYRARSWQYVVRDQMQQLEAQAALLEEKVAQRTRALRDEVEERKRVESALQEARRLEAIGRLTGGVAHDFNNLLQVITASSALMRHVIEDTERAVKIIDTIEHAAERASSLTHQLLAFGRRQTLSSVALDLGRHVTDMKGLLQQSLREKITLELHTAPRLWHAKADPTQLDVALLNLAINAKDAMPSGGKLVVAIRNVTLPSIEVAMQLDLSGEFVWLSVKDNGRGMPPEVARQAFEPFFTTKKIGEGSGLGLSQVYGFAKQSGGDAWIDTGGWGTAVSILLPRSTDIVAGPKKNEKRSMIASDRGETDEVVALRILCVEDDDAVADAAMALLKQFGCYPLRMRSADEALKANLDEVDVVFSDVLMPGSMDGIGLAQELMRRRPDLPVVLASGYATASERLADLEVRFLNKPYTAQSLKDALLNALRNE